MERTILGSYLRVMQARCAQVCEKETLEFGIAYHSGQFAALPDACQFREVFVPDVVRLDEAFRQTERWFDARGLRCLRWAPAEGQPVEHLADFLKGRGFAARRSRIMGLSRRIQPGSAQGVRILPARAMRAAFRQTFGDDDLLAEASLERLDDPHLDMFVAVRDKQPTGRCGLFQTGDIGLVTDLAVAETSAHVEIERALLDCVLALAKRLTLPNVVIQLLGDQPELQSRLETVGFVVAAEHTEFERQCC